MQYQPQHYKWIFFLVVLLVVAVITTPVLADYLGPDRTVVETVKTCKVVLYKCQYVEDKDDYKYKSDESWSCSSEGKPWKDYPSNSHPCNEGQVGYRYWDREEGLEQIIITHPPATITGSIENCTLQNRWCVTAPDLSLSANEPLQGYSILLIEGTRNGEIFACPAGETTCNVPLVEGDNVFTYWALSSWGDSSERGRKHVKVDTVPPDLGLDISGTSGINGWYISPTTVTATGSDVTSGLASALLSLDNISWQPSVTLNEGVYAIAVSASDNAGNMSSSSATISVDTTTPDINFSVTGTVGKNGWYKSDVIYITAVASDATSGIGTFEVAVDGAAYQNYSPITLKDGRHTIQFKAVDNAGNQTETPLQEFHVDTVAPMVDLPASWQLGEQVYYDVWDDESGLASLRIVIEDEDERYAKVAWGKSLSVKEYSGTINWDGQFKDKTVAPPGTYLVWIKASDRAGNEQFHLGEVIVPEPNLLLNLLPTKEPLVVTPLPPVELSETEADPVATASPVTVFGGVTTEPGEISTQSVLLVTGKAGAVSTTSSSGILWGAGALIVSGLATMIAIEANRKRKEAEAAQAARVAAELSEGARERYRHQKKQSENEEKRQAELSTYHSGIGYPGQPSTVGEILGGQGWSGSLNISGGGSLQDTLGGNQEGNIWISDEATQLQDACEQELASASSFGTVSGTGGGTAFSSGDTTGGTTPVNNTSFLQNASGWFQQTPLYLNVSQAVNQAATWAQNTWNTYVQPNLNLKNLAATLLTGALTVTGFQWVSNAFNDPQTFNSAEAYAQVLAQEHLSEYPCDAECHGLLNIIVNPYAVISDGADTLEKLASIVAAYADAIWQQNPLVQMQTQALTTLENELCTGISNQAWSNRCTATFYLLSSINASPFDTAQGVFDTLVFDPVTGMVKQQALGLENIQKFPGLIDAFLDGGLQGALDFEIERLKDNWDKVSHDSQLQSAFFFEGLILLALVAAPLAGGIVLGTTVNGLINLDNTVANAENKQSLIDFVTSHEVRTTVVTSILILTLIATGLGKKALDFRAVQEKLSPEALWDFKNLSSAEQASFVELAIKMKLSPGAMSFYLKQIIDPASGLSKLSMAQALRISSFVDIFGEKAISKFLPFCERYGLNPFELLTKPRTEGQSLFGLVLGIKDPANPVNYPLVDLKLTEAEINNIFATCVKNPDSKVVVLGYGRGVEVPYYTLGEKIEGTYVSIPADMWAPFENARGNFWVEINAPFIEAAIEQRKIFLFNVEYKTIVSPQNIERFSLPELRLIELPQNNYTQVPIGEYTALVPTELLNTYEQYLPNSLLGFGK